MLDQARSLKRSLLGTRAIGPKGVKGGVLRRSPEGYFGRNRSIWLETAQPMRQKAIQSLLSRFRWSPTTSIFDGFLADLNRALSALFSKFRPQKIDSETLGKIRFLTRIRQDLTRICQSRVSPSIDFLARRIGKMKKIQDVFHFSDLRCSKSGKGWVS